MKQNEKGRTSILVFYILDNFHHFWSDQYGTIWVLTMGLAIGPMGFKAYLNNDNFQQFCSDQIGINLEDNFLILKLILI